MPRFERGLPSIVLILSVVVFGAISALVIWLGIDSGEDIVVRIGAAFAASALLSLLFLMFRGLVAAYRGTRQLGTFYQRNRSFLRPLLLVAAAILAPLSLLAAHNYVVWNGIERICVLALEAEDRSESERALQRGRAAMKNPLLLIPSDLFDLWGRNRCNSAERRWEDDGVE